MARTTTLGCLVIAALLCGCGDGGFIGGPGADGGRDGWFYPEASADFVPRLDASCGGQKIPIVLQQKGEIPDLHLVVDRSGSMFAPIDIFQLQLGFKWDAMKKTLGAMVDHFTGNIRFGLTLFPKDDSCGAGQIDVALGLGNEGTIKQKLELMPNGNTPTHTTLAAVQAYLATVPVGPGERYVLLATDGVPNCGAEADSDTSAETLAAVQSLAATGVKVVVVGFGSIVAGDPVLLDQLAVAGGAPNPNGPHKFYPATNEQELQQALFAIAGGIIPPPCSYALTSAPPEPDKVTVTFDGQPVPRSASNSDGWNYTAGGSEITFFGPTCDRLRTGQVNEVSFIYGCKGPEID